MQGDLKPVENDEERTQFLQRVLLDYLAVRGQVDPALTYSRHFYLAQWYQDNIKNVNTSPKQKASKTAEDSKRGGSRSSRKQPGQSTLFVKLQSFAARGSNLGIPDPRPFYGLVNPGIIRICNLIVIYM